MVQPASAQSDRDPERVFHKCSQEIRHILSRCKATHAGIVEDCVPRIRELLEAGHREEARLLAARCIERIETAANRCVRHTKEICERCIHTLRELEAYELAHQLAHRCENAVKDIRQMCHRAVHAIRRAFETDGTDGGDGGGDET